MEEMTALTRLLEEVRASELHGKVPSNGDLSVTLSRLGALYQTKQERIFVAGKPPN